MDKTTRIWLEEHPGIRIRETLGVVRNMQAVATHLWHDDVAQAQER